MNKFVIIVIFGQCLCKSVPMILINLTVSNIAICILILHFIIISGYSTEYVFGLSEYICCKMCYFVSFNLCLVLVPECTIVFISVERLLYFKLPVKYECVITTRRAVVVVLLIWIVCILPSIPPLLGLGEVLFFYKIANCAFVSFADGTSKGNASYWVMLGLLGFLGLSVTVIDYLWILFIARNFLCKKADHYASLNGSQCLQTIQKSLRRCRRNIKRDILEWCNCWG